MITPKLRLTILIVFFASVACNPASSGGGGGGGTNVPTNVSACASGALFSALPIPVANLSESGGIVPLGNLNPPDHTFPAAHLYFYLKDSDGFSGAPVDSSPLYAPGSGVVSAISSSTQASTGFTDYTITFFPCGEVEGYFNHVASLEGSVKTAFDGATGDCTTYNPGSGNYTRCTRSVNVTLTPGEQIGTGGGPTTGSLAVDFGLYDSRIKAHTFANNARVQTSSGFDTFHIACAIDYFSNDLKSQLEGRLHRVAGATPLCGTYDQDVSGTAQGKWFQSSAASPATTESGNVALVHDNYNPTLGVFSIGNSSMGVGSASFTPANSGTTNRDFNDVTADGKTYCYETLSTPGIIFLIQMPNATSLKIEKQTANDCSGSPTFSSSAITFVR